MKRVGLGGPLEDAAANAVAALSNDPNYCARISTPGTAVNTAVHAFKVAWNAAHPEAPLHYNGQFDLDTFGALVGLGVNPPNACGGGAPVPPPQPMTPPSPPPQPATPPTPLAKADDGKTNWTPWLIGGAAILGIGAISYALMSGGRPAARRRPAHENPLSVQTGFGTFRIIPIQRRSTGRKAYIITLNGRDLKKVYPTLRAASKARARMMIYGPE